jgi:hypothetical protein
MALPFQFANATTIVTTQLDANYNALGALTPIPCVVAGANTIVMTPLANTPTVSSYQNYMQFSGIAAATNTTTVTVSVGGLPTLPGYKDTPTGPIAMIAGDLAQNTQFTAIYDLALNSGNGGFHVNPNSASVPVPGLFGTPGINANSANTDNPINISLPVGYTKYRINNILSYNPSTSMTTASAGVFTAVAGGGTTVVSSVALAALTTNTPGSSGSMLAHSVVNVNSAFFTSPTLYYRILSAQGTVATVDVMIQVVPLL